jgi:hypothetical protein
MMGERQVDQGALFYEFSLERHVPADPLLRAIDRFVDLGDLRARLAPFYSPMGRPSIDPELLIRMLLIGTQPLKREGRQPLPSIRWASDLAPGQLCNAWHGPLRLHSRFTQHRRRLRAECGPRDWYTKR